MTNNNNNNNNPTTIDLSTASDHGIQLILLEIPADDLVNACNLVSRQWYHVLNSNLFWKEKLRHDGHTLEWPRFASLSAHALQNIAVKRPFGRNLVRDSWDLSKKSADCYQPDHRWTRWPKQILWNEDDTSKFDTRVEVPPRLRDGPKPDPDTGKDVTACLATGNSLFRQIRIELAKEGLTAEIMDNLRPTIVVSELVSNHRNYGSAYFLLSRLMGQEKSSTLSVDLRFTQGDEEGWRKVEHLFKNYSAGMRYLVVGCHGGKKDTQFTSAGVKTAKLSVRALCELNAKSLEEK